jgi:hypothetical protein
MPSLQKNQCILKATPQTRITNTSENEKKEMNLCDPEVYKLSSILTRHINKLI